MLEFMFGFICGAMTVGITVIIAELRDGDDGLDPHCMVCAKLMHRCRCKGGPV